MDNATPSMDKRVFHGCAQVFVGALYPSHGVISTNDIGQIHGWGVSGHDGKKKKFSNNNLRNITLSSLIVFD